MTNATDVIAHLLPRKAAPIVERQTGLPFGWGLWLRALPERLGRITREKADAILDLLASHTPKPRRAAPFLPSRFYALRSLFFQGWGRLRTKSAGCAGPRHSPAAPCICCSSCSCCGWRW